MKNRGFIRELGLATAMVLALAGSAQAAQPADQPYPLSDATRFSVQGQRHAVAATGGEQPGADCRVPQPSLYLAPDERAIELRQLSLDPRTCRATFERGVPPRSARPSPSGARESTGARRDGTAGGVGALGDGYKFGGWGRAWYRDIRTNKVVTEVNSGADWNPKGTCIGTNNIWFANYASTHTGWSEVSHNWAYLNTRCDYLVSRTDAHFRDRNFSGCSGGGPVLDSYYRRVRFVGYPNGGIKGSRSSRNEPSCQNVLYAYFALYRR